MASVLGFSCEGLYIRSHLKLGLEEAVVRSTRPRLWMRRSETEHSLTVVKMLYVMTGSVCSILRRPHGKNNVEPEREALKVATSLVPYPIRVSLFTLHLLPDHTFSAVLTADTTWVLGWTTEKGDRLCPSRFSSRLGGGRAGVKRHPFPENGGLMTGCLELKNVRKGDFDGRPMKPAGRCEKKRSRWKLPLGLSTPRS